MGCTALSCPISTHWRTQGIVMADVSKELRRKIDKALVITDLQLNKDFSCGIEDDD